MWERVSLDGFRRSSRCCRWHLARVMLATMPRPWPESRSSLPCSGSGSLGSRLSRVAGCGRGGNTCELRRGAVPIGPAELDAIDGQLRLPSRVSVRVSAQTKTPFAIGIVWRIVVVPPEFLGQPPACQRAILAHELVHLERRDELWLGFENLICCLFFFHPLAWLAARRAALTREVLCDATALERSAMPRATYAKTLLGAAGSVGPRVAAAFSPSHRTLEHRIRAVLRRDDGRGGFSGATVISAAVLFMALGVPGLPVAATSGPAALVADPLPGARVSSSFGLRRDPIARAHRHHDGIDLVAPHGTSVRAAGDGVVRKASRGTKARGAAGLMVLIDHGGGRSTFYAHLSAVDVERGQRVRAGEHIGAVGRTGRVTGTHLHFEVLQGNTPADPALTFPRWSKEAS